MVQNLQQLYVEELRDLCSANDQMQAVIDKMAGQASDDKLRALLQRSITGIRDHTKVIREMLPEQTQDIKCRGMQGLVEEATRHAIEADLPDTLRDIAMIAQYQRMSHYGLAGFGTAAAYAEAIGAGSEANTLRAIVEDIYQADEYSSMMAERLEEAVVVGDADASDEDE